LPLSAIGLRILFVWLYNNTGRSLFAVIVFHAMANVSSSFISTVAGIPLIAITAVIVTFLWGSKTLARYRYAVRLPLIPRDNRGGEVETELSPTHRR
jgi:uncharacterized protein